MKNRIIVSSCALLLVACFKSGTEDDAGPGDAMSAVDVPPGPDAPSFDVGGPDTGSPIDATPSVDAGPPLDAPGFDTGADVAIDAGPPVQVGLVDMLFVIDNSGSMDVEQASLAAEVPRIVTTLASGMSEDRVFPSLMDLRVGVVSSDMGTGGYTIPSCNEPNFGDDGILNRGTGCGLDAASPPYIGLRPADGDDPVAFGDAAACLVRLGTQGCGFEQPLDSMLKALAPANATLPGGEPLVFVNSSRAHGDGANRSFLRPESLLVVVVLTDEDDCSAANPDLYNRDSATFTDPDLNLRCSRYGDPSIGAVHPVSRYIDGLLAIHPPERTVFYMIAGIPVDLVPAPGEAANYELLVGDEAVRDPRMIERPDPMMPSQLTPVCAVAARGVAYPALRLVRVARGLERSGAAVVLQSICQDDYGPLIDSIIDHL